MNYKQKHSWRMRGWKQKQKKHLLWSLSSYRACVPSVMALSLKASFYARATTLVTPLTWVKPTEGKNIGFQEPQKPNLLLDSIRC